MTSKHTPGPWHEGSTIDGYTAFMAQSEDVYVCWVDFEKKEDKILALAAPDLLEALILADATLLGANMNTKVVERKVREAIAKATGEQQ